MGLTRAISLSHRHHIFITTFITKWVFPAPLFDNKKPRSFPRWRRRCRRTCQFQEATCCRLIFCPRRAAPPWPSQSSGPPCWQAQKKPHLTPRWGPASRVWSIAVSFRKKSRPGDPRRDGAKTTDIEIVSWKDGDCHLNLWQRLHDLRKTKFAINQPCVNLFRVRLGEPTYLSRASVNGN